MVSNEQKEKVFVAIKKIVDDGGRFCKTFLHIIINVRMKQEVSTDHLDKQFSTVSGWLIRNSSAVFFPLSV